MFLKLAAWLYCKVESPNATINAHMKHNTEAAKACGIEARMAPTFPVKSKLINQLYLSSNRHKYAHYICHQLIGLIIHIQKTHSKFREFILGIKPDRSVFMSSNPTL